MNKHLNELIELSRIDKAIDDFRPLIETAKKKLARKVAKRDEINKKIITIKRDIEDIENKIILYEGQIKVLNEQLILSVGKEKGVKSEKEAKALQTEIDFTREKLNTINSDIEKQNKVLDIKREELEKSLLVELESANKEVEKVSASVTEKINLIESEKAKLFAMREKHTLTIDQKILSFYEKIRIWAKNTAVVPVKKQACYGCYMKLNDSAYATIIKSEEINTCHHCGRILYIEKQTAEEMG